MVRAGVVAAARGVDGGSGAGDGSGNALMNYSPAYTA